MANLSIIIPYRREPYLDRTIASFRENAIGEVEVLAMDGSLGMRSAINEGLKQATGDYIMKVDAHCIVGKGYDEILIKDCQENWLMIPRRYSLNEERWERDESCPVWDYHFFSFPQPSSYGLGLFPAGWHKRNDLEIDDTLTFQGSLWLANRKYFMEHVGLLDDRVETYGGFADEPLEIGLKYWLGGGEIKADKKTWYAHLQKRGYHYDAGTFSRRHKKDGIAVRAHTWAAKHWMNNEEPNMIHPFNWLIEKFWPVPTWPEDRSLWKV